MKNTVFKMFVWLSLAVGAWFASISISVAAPIAGLVNTPSSNVAGAPVAAYTFLQLSGAHVGNTGAGKTTGNQYPSVWMGNTASSGWITQDTAFAIDATSDVLWRWRLTFDLTGVDASTATFVARWAMDDFGYASLNGAVLPDSNVPAGLYKSPSSPGYAHWTAFGAASGFVSGVNTLDFFVTNEYHGAPYNPSGVRVEFMSSAVSAVPTPASGALMLAGLGVLGLVRRRRLA